MITYYAGNLLYLYQHSHYSGLSNNLGHAITCINNLRLTIRESLRNPSSFSLPLQLAHYSKHHNSKRLNSLRAHPHFKPSTTGAFPKSVQPTSFLIHDLPSSFSETSRWKKVKKWWEFKFGDNGKDKRLNMSGALSREDERERSCEILLHEKN